MRKSRKGFTLVEIIVVLVILAILAAFTIPSMLGFIGEAKKKAALAEQREVYVAAQAIITEHVAKEGKAAAMTVAVAAVPPVAGVGGSSAIPAGSLGMDASNIATNLGSAAVKTAIDAAATTGVAVEMSNYLSGDIVAGDGTGAAALWTVEVNPANGKIVSVTYKRDGVQLDPLKPNGNLK
ncbi:prepilin-type N-terminal cleavage/methylation domain-containing protein [Acetobacterium malicum]|uniref:Prepilin-type N-terminal cleavage/methylation domain-containing protein n=1 Tax=Acetobacterium malicum TaxID=52692 RepID=A0ABR6YXF5_9FIRM|nr:prepilin-type N-terminal cleavage/methylation domain-containing protein [Acetobacterium malicum]